MYVRTWGNGLSECNLIARDIGIIRIHTVHRSEVNEKEKEKKRKQLNILIKAINQEARTTQRVASLSARHKDSGMELKPRYIKAFVLFSLIYNAHS